MGSFIGPSECCPHRTEAQQADHCLRVEDVTDGVGP